MKTKITVGSDNVFADLGFADAVERLAKADLAIAIGNEIDAKGWNQTLAADHLAMTRPQISKIRNGKLDEFSRERLESILLSLGIDVEITLRPRGDGKAGTLSVVPSRLAISRRSRKVSLP